MKDWKINYVQNMIFFDSEAAASTTLKFQDA